MNESPAATEERLKEIRRLVYSLENAAYNSGAANAAGVFGHEYCAHQAEAVSKVREELIALAAPPATA